MQPFKIRLNIENTKLKFHLSLRLFSVKAAANFSQSKVDDISGWHSSCDLHDNPDGGHSGCGDVQGE